MTSDEPQPDQPDADEFDEEDGIYAVECTVGGAETVSGSRVVLADTATVDELIEAIVRSVRAASVGFSAELAMALEVRLLWGEFGAQGENLPTMPDS